jgi:glycosyltransferase involved in cell wall biosynthesis
MKKFLFNFSASYTGGGLKRLEEFSKCFNDRGGCYFIIHENCSFLIDKYNQNQYFVVSQSRLSRLFNDCAYLDDIFQALPNIQFYYSYGIPIYGRYVEKQWFHLSNVAPLIPFEISLSLFEKIKCFVLGWKIKYYLGNYDYVSTESNYSSDFFKNLPTCNSLVLTSVNGADDEIEIFNSGSSNNKFLKQAICVGTHKYKRIDRVFKIFLELLIEEPELNLIIIGEIKGISKKILSHPRVKATGVIERNEVISYLLTSKYYITATEVENSYNAASEGIFLSEYSFISSIQPHLELLKNLPYKKCKFNSLDDDVLFLKKEELSAYNLKTWDQLIHEMLADAGLN